jgi:hypothetical protein
MKKTRFQSFQILSSLGVGDVVHISIPLLRFLRMGVDGDAIYVVSPMKVRIPNLAFTDLIYSTASL